MEAVSENTENVTLFWELFNEVLEKVSSGTTTIFNPIGLCTNMAGSNFSTIRKVFGDSAVNCIKKLSEDKATQFKDILIKLLELEIPKCYDILNYRTVIESHVRRNGGKPSEVVV